MPPRIDPLSWDSQWLGFGVGRLRPEWRDEAELTATLADFAAAGGKLAYLTVPAARTDLAASARLVGGIPVGDRVEFRRDLPAAGPASGRKATAPAFAPRAPIHIHRSAAPDQDLFRLSILAGRHSRFRIDSRIPQERFEHVYREWIRKSVSGELADRVLVARADDGAVLGMATAATRGDTGSIGLIAVDPAAQGKGLGAMLMAEAVRYFAGQSCRFATVVTQQANEAACRLYRKAGFSVSSHQHDFHFWLSR